MAGMYYSEKEVVAFLGAFTGYLMNAGLIEISAENIIKSGTLYTEFWKKYKDAEKDFETTKANPNTVVKLERTTKMTSETLKSKAGEVSA